MTKKKKKKEKVFSNAFQATEENFDLTLFLPHIY